jgi:hypothetical protein
VQFLNVHFYRQLEIIGDFNWHLFCNLWTCVLPGMVLGGKKQKGDCHDGEKSRQNFSGNEIVAGGYDRWIRTGG